MKYSLSMIFCLLLVSFVDADSDTFEVGPGKEYKTITEALADAKLSNAATKIVKIFPSSQTGGKYLCHTDVSGVNGKEPGLIAVSNTTNALVIEGVNPSGGRVIIDGNRTQALPTEHGAMLIDASSTNVTIKNLQFENSFYAGIKSLNGGSNHRLENVRCYKNEQYGAQLLADEVVVVDCYFEDNFLRNSVGAGLFLGGFNTQTNQPGGDDSRIENCTSKGNEGDGFDVRDSSNVVVTGCTANDNDRQGFLTQKTTGVFLDGGDFCDNGASGVQVEVDCTDCIVRGVTANDNNTKANGEAGIWVDCSTNVLVEDCEVKGNMTGIRISGADPVTIGKADRVIVRYNRVSQNKTSPIGGGATLAGIEFNQAENCAIYHNTVWDNGTSSDGNYGIGTHGQVMGGQSPNSNVYCVNNIVGKTDGIRQLELHDVDQMGDIDSNVYFDPPSSSNGYDTGAATMSFAPYKTAMSVHGHAQNSDEASAAPIFNTLTPKPGREAHDSARPLGTIDLIVGDDIIFAKPGRWARVGDKVKFSNGEVYTVADVGDDFIVIPAHTLSVGLTARLDRTYHGSAPDIGAVERPN